MSEFAKAPFSIFLSSESEEKLIETMLEDWNDFDEIVVIIYSSFS